MDLYQTHVFNPKFTKVHSVAECADLINRPHEDYPDRVNRTIDMIQHHIDHQIKVITESMYRAIHSYIMWDLPSYQRGAWRTIDVTVGRFQPCPPYLIQTELEERGLLLIALDDQSSDDDIIQWYAKFETVHPFVDGNGRVGGVIAAVASHHLSGGKYLLAPEQ